MGGGKRGVRETRQLFLVSCGKGRKRRGKRRLERGTLVGVFVWVLLFILWETLDCTLKKCSIFGKDISEYTFSSMLSGTVYRFL